MRARLRISEIERVAEAEPAPPNHDRSAAEQRFAWIVSLIDRGVIPRPEIDAAAAEAGVTPATIHRWLSEMSYSGHLSSLVPTTAGGDPAARDRALNLARAATRNGHALLRHPRSNRAPITAGEGSLPVWPVPPEPSGAADDEALFETAAVPFDDIVPADFQR